MTEEIWKDIEGYEGKYQVSNLGRVKSLSNNKTKKEKILKPRKDKDGYLLVTLCKNGKNKTYKVHRLVVENFMGKPLDKDYYSVNHIDEGKSNNKLENLQYCTVKYNANYGTRNERMSKSKNKPVIGINKINGYICEFNSISEAGIVTTINISNIAECCKGKRKSAGGYRWFYANSKEVEK